MERKEEGSRRIGRIMNRGDRLPKPDSVRLELPQSGSGIPVSRDDVLTDADWPFLDPAERRAPVRKHLYVLLFVLLSALFSIGSVGIHRADESGFIVLERIGAGPRLPFHRQESLSEMSDQELAAELGVTLAELYEAEDVMDRFLRRTDKGWGPLDWQIRVPFGAHVLAVNYRIFLNMGISAIIALALYIRARDRAGSAVIDAQNRQLRELNVVLQRKIEEARQYLDELGQAQYKLVQAEKLASIGRMSATLAHEIRNPMSIIQSAAGIAAEDVPKGSPPWEAIELIRQEVARLDRIIAELLNFARPKPPNIDRHELGALLEAWTYPLHEELGKDNVRLRVSVDEGVPLVKVDPDQLYQVVLNVVWNARDALKTQGGGGIDVRAERGGGRTVRVVVSDDGPGMDAETLDQICEPFFTTKTHGSGLGIPVVQQLMEGMGGSARIASEIERGTTVTLEMVASRLSRKALKAHREKAIAAAAAGLDADNTDGDFLHMTSASPADTADIQ